MLKNIKRFITAMLAVSFMLLSIIVISPAPAHAEMNWWWEKQSYSVHHFGPAKHVYSHSEFQKVNQSYHNVIHVYSKVLPCYDSKNNFLCDMPAGTVKANTPILKNHSYNKFGACACGEIKKSKILSGSINIIKEITGIFN